MKYQVKTRQIILFFIAFVPIIKLFMLPCLIAERAQNDLWISSVINLAVDLLTLYIILSVCKRYQVTFFDLLQELLGKKGAKVLCFLYAIYFLLKGFMPLQEQKEFVKLSLYINLPTDLFFLPFFGLAFYLCLKPLRAIGRISDICWIFTLIGFFLLIFLSFSGVDWGALFPVGIHLKGASKGTFVSFNWWGDCVYALFFMGNFKYCKKDAIKIFWAYLFSGLLVVLALVFFWGTFTWIAFRQKFAMTELSKYTTVINNIGRFDYVGIIFILFSCAFALALPLFFSSKLLDYSLSVKKPWLSPLITVGITLILTLALNQSLSTVTNLFLSYSGWIFLIFSNLLPIIICLIKLFKGEGREKIKT